MISDAPLLVEMVQNGIEVIFHDAHLKKVINHAHYDEILTYPPNIKDKLYLMHHGLLSEKDAPSDGIKFLYQHREYEF